MNESNKANNTEKPFKSGFVAFYGRPNVGKSTLLNKIVDKKVSIVSNKAQTTRNDIRGVLHRSDSQIVFVDTPGVSKPRTKLGERLNSTAASASSDVDVVCFVVDGRSGFGKGDRLLAERCDPSKTVLVLNKIDGMKKEAVLAQLSAVAEFDFSSYFPVSAWDGKGVEELIEHLLGRMPAGPEWYEPGQISDKSESFAVAELVREQLLRMMAEELPHSIATRVVEWDWPLVRVEILVERESQKGIVIGQKGEVLKKVGSRVRKQLPEGAYLELVVNVNKNWQASDNEIERLGY